MAIGKTGYIDVVINPSSVGKVRAYWREDYNVEGNYSVITLTGAEAYLSHRYGTTQVAMAFSVDGTLFFAEPAANWVFYAGADGTWRSVTNSSTGAAFGGVSTGPIYHDDSTGERTITLTFTLVDVYNSSAGFNGSDNQSASVSIALTKIPRASSISATDANVEAVSSIAVNRKSSAYTHSIQYQFGNRSGYINADGSVSSSEVKLSETNIGFTVPAEFYDQIPDSKTGICTLTVKTYSGSTQIGDAKTCTFTVTAAESNCAPAVSGTVVDVNETTLALTGDENKLVRFFSNALATITATAKNSASIASKLIAGVEVSEDTRTIEAVETASFAFAATDSRGYSNSASVTKTLIEYIKLTANMSVTRDDPTSGKATLIIKGDYFNGSFGAVDNSLTVQFRIDDGDWVSITPTIDGNTYIAVAALTDLDYQSTFAFDVVAADKLMNVPKSDMLNKGIANFHMGEDDVTFEVPVNVKGALNVGDAATTRANLGLGAVATEDVVPIEKGGTGAEDAETALSNLGAISMKRLWTNASPTSNFGAQTITFSETDYQYYRVALWEPSGEHIVFAEFPVGGKYTANIPVGNTGMQSGSISIISRAMTSTQNSITFGNALYKGGSSDWGAFNNNVIPCEVIGIKGVK